VLASASPRRADLLAQIGIPFEVIPSDVREDLTLPLEPERHVLVLARLKAEDVARKRPGSLVLGADTIVVREGTILGKPVDAADACRMLRLLSGRWHEVMTGVALRQEKGGKKREAVEVTRVKFRDLGEEEIREYVATGEPLDKAGAYGIQGKGAVLVERIEGCYFNVVGLPLARLTALLGDL
jgi:septum formation protein